MRARLLSVALLVGLIAAGTLPVQASSLPFVQGRVSALELCPKSLCGAAIFVGVFAGQVGAGPALGTVAVAVTHEDLPDPGESADITGGQWVIQLLSGRKLSGLVAGGTLINNGDDTFEVRVAMLLTGGGVGTLRFGGTLSHRVFPPTLIGTLLP